MEFFLLIGTFEEDTQPVLPIINEDRDSDTNSVSSSDGNGKVFSGPSSVSSMDSSVQWCISPKQAGITPPASVENKPARVLALPVEKRHQRSRSAIKSIQKPVRSTSVPRPTPAKVPPRKRRSSSMSEDNEDHEKYPASQG